MWKSLLFAIVFLAAHAGNASAQFFQIGKCGLLTPPRNGMIRKCSAGSRSGSVCTLECLSGYSHNSAERRCACIGSVCVWEGTNPTCTKVECPRPDHEDGRIIVVDRWPTGFAGLIEFGQMESDFTEGWSAVIAFNKQMGQNAKLSSWTAELAGVSPERDAFTFNNAPFNDNGTATNIKALFVVDHVQGELPTQGYAGLYNRRLADATCFHKSAYTPLQSFSSYSTPPPTTTTTTTTTTPTTPETTEATTQSTNPLVPSTSPGSLVIGVIQVAVESPQSSGGGESQSVEPSTSGASAPTSSAAELETTVTLESTTRAVKKVTTTTMGTTTAMVTPTTEAAERRFVVPGNRQCKYQGAEGYRTQPGWVDKGQPHFSGNAISQVTETIDDWMVVVVYQVPLESIQTWNVVQAGTGEDGLVWMFGPMQWNSQLHKGELNINFIAILKTAIAYNPDGRVYLCSTQIVNGDPVLLFSDTSFPATQPVAGGHAEEDEEDDDDAPSTVAQTANRQPTTTTEAAVTELALAPGNGTTPNPTHEQRCRSGAPTGRSPRQPRQTKPRWKKSKDKTAYDYNEILHKSNLFYEAQRAGSLPPRYNRIPWRGDATLKDGCSVGVDLSGGWFDAGDHVKFTFPMAYSVTVLSWGGILFRKAYVDAGVLSRTLGSVKWPVNYLMRAHTSKYELVAQVGNGQDDHDQWGRPEELPGSRPVYKITKTAPGSELAAETAAALAAASIFLRRTHRVISIVALRHAKELYEFATTYKGHYHESVPEVYEFYRSFNGYDDELIWAGLWLYKATRIQKYLTEAKQTFVRIGGGMYAPPTFDWDNKLAGAQVLLAEITGESQYRKAVEMFLNRAMTAIPKTPQGLLWPNEWAPNRYTANAAMIAVAASMLKPALPKKAQYLEFAKTQLHLMLGDSGRSYVVGIGSNYPRRIHHRASSCPPPPATCGWPVFRSSRANHFILYGALVGGPDQQGVFLDQRSNHRQSEVATDYNAGFQGAIAGLKYFAMQNRTKTG